MTIRNMHPSSLRRCCFLRGKTSADHVCKTLLQKSWSKHLQEESLFFKFFKTSSPTLSPSGTVSVHPTPLSPRLNRGEQWSAIEEAVEENRDRGERRWSRAAIEEAV
ncbi:hypothetical protein R6Q59_007089 [Mikania micrantha]